MNYGRIRAGMGLTVLLGINLHVGKSFGRDGSHCNIREELERRQGPLYHQGRIQEVWKNLGRSGAHCATRDKFACGEEVRQDWVPLCH